MNMDKSLLIDLYPTMSNAEIAKILNISENNVSVRAWQLGLKKDATYLSSVNRRNGRKGLIARGVYG
jgi:transposase